jgi:hypothetical protein
MIFSAKHDGSPAVRYQHVSVVTFYLREARAHVSRALELERGETQFAEALLRSDSVAQCLEHSKTRRERTSCRPPSSRIFLGATKGLSNTGGDRVRRTETCRGISQPGELGMSYLGGGR